MFNTFYSTNLAIPTMRIQANTKEEAEAIMQKFIDKIAPIMSDIISWDEVDWSIQENVYDEVEKGIMERKSVAGYTRTDVDDMLASLNELLMELKDQNRPFVHNSIWKTIDMLVGMLAEGMFEE
jgi:hypothetical protein